MVCIYFIKNNSLVRFIITIFQNDGSVEVTAQYNTIQDFFMVNLYYWIYLPKSNKGIWLVSDVHFKHFFNENFPCITLY